MYLKLFYIISFIFLLHLNYGCSNQINDLEKEVIFKESPRVNIYDSILQNVPKLRAEWMHLLEDSSLIASFRPLVSNEKVIYSKSINPANPEIICFSSKDGEVLWKIENFTDNYTLLTPSNFYYYNSERFIQMIPDAAVGNDYIIVDLSTGTIEGRSAIDYKSIQRGITGYQNFALLTTKPNGGSYASSQIRRVDLNNNANQLLFNIPKDPAYKYEDIRAPEMIHKRGHDSLIVYAHNKWNNSPFETHNELVAYNLSKKKEQWRNFMSDGGIYVNRGRPIVLPDKMIVASDSVWCVEPYSGDILWSKKYTPGLSGMAHWNGRIIFGIEGWDARMIALDATTGSEIWNVPANGNGSNIEIFEDNIYYVGGGELHVLDAETGKEYYAMEAPFRENNSSLFFQTTLTIDPKKRLIFLCDYAHALCYSIE